MLSTARQQHQQTARTRQGTAILILLLRQTGLWAFHHLYYGAVLVHEQGEGRCQQWKQRPQRRFLSEAKREGGPRGVVPFPSAEDTHLQNILSGASPVAVVPGKNRTTSRDCRCDLRVKLKGRDSSTHSLLSGLHKIRARWPPTRKNNKKKAKVVQCDSWVCSTKAWQNNRVHGTTVRSNCLGCAVEF